MDSYGVWDLIYRYLLPDWWIIPVYVTVTAWVATIAWWRRAIRLGLAWAQRVSVVLSDAPAARRYGLRLAIAAPLFVIPALVLAVWYLFGCALAGWNDNTFHLVPSVYSVVTFSYALVGIVAAARALDEDDIELFLKVTAGFSLPLSAPVLLFGLFMAFVGLAVGLMSEIADEPEWSYFKIGAAVLAGGLVPILGFCAAGWTALRGMEIIIERDLLYPYPGTRPSGDEAGVLQVRPSRKEGCR